MNVEDKMGKHTFNFRFKLKDSSVADLKDKDISKLRIKIEASHAGIINGNYFMYTPDGMNDGASSFVEPFEKPLLTNHDTYSDALGRVKSARYVVNPLVPPSLSAAISSAKTEQDIADAVSDLTNSVSFNEDSYRGLGYLELLVDVVDKDAIEKVLDSRYSEVSISANTDVAICSTCGVDVKKEKDPYSHPHWKGEVHDGEETFFIGGKLTYKEVSFVNTPADHLVGTEVVSDSSTEGMSSVAYLEILDYEETGEDSTMSMKELLEDKLACSKKVTETLVDLGLSSFVEPEDSLSKLRKTSFLFAEDKMIPIKGKAYVLAATKILTEAEDKDSYEDALTVLSGKMKRHFGEGVSIDDAVALLKKEVNVDTSDVKDEAKEGKHKDATLSPEEVRLLIADAVVEKLQSVMAQDTKGYSASRVELLEQEIESLESENEELSNKLKDNVVHQILSAEDKVEDSKYKSLLLSRNIESLVDKLYDMTAVTDGACDADSKDAEDKKELSGDVSVDDAAVESGTKSEDGSEVIEKTLSVRDVQIEYGKLLKSEGLVKAHKYLKTLGDENKLPESFTMNSK